MLSKYRHVAHMMDNVIAAFHEKLCESDLRSSCKDVNPFTHDESADFFLEIFWQSIHELNVDLNLTKFAAHSLIARHTLHPIMKMNTKATY